MSRERPTSYAELADLLESLPFLVAETRRRKGLSIRAAAKELGCSFSTVLRIESGEDYNSRLLPDLLRWIGGAS